METSPREIGERKQTGETLLFQCIIKMANNKTESIEVFFNDVARSSSISNQTELDRCERLGVCLEGARAFCGFGGLDVVHALVLNETLLF
jgi:hypothetical protein